MNDLDHMLNGRSSRQKIEHLIRQAEQYKLARDIEAAQGKHKHVLPLSTLLLTLMNLIRR